MRKKVNFDEINWQRQGKLYRGTFQVAFERNCLEEFSYGNLSYFGSINRPENEKFTSCAGDLEHALFYPLKRDITRFHTHIKNKPQAWPFTLYPVVMEINAENYKDFLFKGDEESDFVIAKPISLDDITVIFSFNLDALDRYSLKKEAIEYFKSQIEKTFPKNADLFSYYKEKPEEVLAELCFRAYGPKIQYTEKDKMKFKKFINILRKKLKGK